MQLNANQKNTGIMAKHTSSPAKTGSDEKGAAQMGDKTTDQMLVERVQNGETHAFDLLVTKYQTKLFHLVNRYVTDQDEALDVVQESFIKSYRAIQSFRGDSAFYTWLFRIAVNTAKNYLATQKRRPPQYDVDAVEAEQYGGENRLKDRDTPENELLRDEIQNTVQQAMDKLPDDLRTAIVLREMEGLSYEEIAQVMDCPIGTVRSRIFRARDAIDQKLKPLLNHE